MGKKKVPSLPDPDTIYLYIENPYGMGTGADLRKGGQPLVVISQWLYAMVGNRIAPPTMIWTHPKKTAIIVPLDIPNRDQTQVRYMLGHHFWREFVKPNAYSLRALGGPEVLDNAMSSVYICTIQAEDDIHEHFNVELHDKVNFTDFLGDYPSPHLPDQSTPRTGMREGLPAAPRPTTPPLPPEAFPSLSQADEEEEKKKKPFIKSQSPWNGRPDVKPNIKTEAGGPSAGFKLEIAAYDSNPHSYAAAASPTKQEPDDKSSILAELKQEAASYLPGPSTPTMQDVKPDVKPMFSPATPVLSYASAAASPRRQTRQLQEDTKPLIKSEESYQRAGYAAAISREVSAYTPGATPQQRQAIKQEVMSYAKIASSPGKTHVRLKEEVVAFRPREDVKPTAADLAHLPGASSSSSSTSQGPPPGLSRPKKEDPDTTWTPPLTSSNIITPATSEETDAKPEPPGARPPKRLSDETEAPEGFKKAKMEHW